MAHSPPAWPAAVSPLALSVLHGPERPARVLGAFPTALYLGTGRHEQVLPLLTVDALRLPTGLLLARRSSDVDWGVDTGASVVVGGGGVRLPGRDVVGVRTHRPTRVGGGDPWATSAPSWTPGPAADLLATRGGSVLHTLATDAVRCALAGLDVDGPVGGLVGAGRGLTPSGDDALCGVLLALRGAGGPRARDAHRALAASVRGRLHRTTSLSASLLLAAEQGYAVPAVVRLVSLLTRPTAGGPAEVLEDALAEVLSIGHSSGTDLVAGISGTLAALAAQPSRPHRAPNPTQEGSRRA